MTKIPSGNTTTPIRFVPLSSGARVTGLTSGWTVKRKRGTNAGVTMTDPTITEVSGMAGVYELIADEDTTITSGLDEEAIIFSIEHSSLDTTNVEATIQRPKITAGETITTDSSGRASSNVVLMANDVLTGNAVAASVGTEIAAAIETALVNDGDATAFLQAVADKINLDMQSSDLTAIAIATAVVNNSTMAAALVRLMLALPAHAAGNSLGLALQTTAELAAVNAGVAVTNIDNVSDKLGEPTASSIAEDIANVAGNVTPGITYEQLLSALEAATAFGPVEQEEVPEECKIYMIPQEGEALSSGSKMLELIIADTYGTETNDQGVLCSLDWTKVIGEPPARLSSFNSITLLSGEANGIQMTRSGIDHAESKFVMTPVVAGDYVFLARVKVAGSNAYRSGTFRVRAIDLASIYGT